MRDVTHSTIRGLPDGGVSRWNPIVGRWQDEARPAAQAQRPALAVRTAPGAAARPIPFAPDRRSYAAARTTRTTAGFGSSGNSSADAEIASGLTSLRSRARQMVRDSAYAKRAQLVIVNNVIGTGVGMQAQVGTTRGATADRVNTAIEDAWSEWCAADACHTGGALHFHDLERALLGQVFEAGEIFVRKHHMAFGGSRVPLSLEIIEPERLAHELVDPGAMMAQGEVRMGVEVDEFGRAAAYWIRRRHPGDLRGRVGQSDRFERVPASDIYHLRIVERWPQTRGVPWLHTVLRKIDELNEYSQHEVSAARASAAYFATITTPEDGNGLVSATDSSTGQQLMDIESLTIQSLHPGEELQFHAPNRPNAALDPFMRAMLREVAAGCGASYESLSRDYSQSNYSSSRLALLDDRDLYRTLQQWWIRAFRQPLHRMWLQQAVLAGAIPAVPAAQYAADAAKYEAVLFKPRGWMWVDPTKEVAAYKEAIKAGLTTTTDVISQTAGGMDIEDIIKTRKRELEMFADAGIELDTTVAEPALMPAAPPAAPAAQQPEDPEAPDDEPAKAAGRVLHINRA